MVSRGCLRPTPKPGDPLLVRMACKEAREWARGRGILSRTVGPHRDPPSRRAWCRSKDDEKALRKGRKCYDSQYAACINGYLYIIAMEQVLRSCAEGCGVEHMRGVTPISVEYWAPKLGLHENVIEDIMTVFSSKKANVRNRVLHCGLLDPGPRAQEARLSALEIKKCVRKPASPESPENVALFCEVAFSKLLREVRQRDFGTTNLDWTSVLVPNHQLLEFGKRLNCNLLENSTSFSGWYVRLCHYVDVNMPCLGELLKLGLLNFLAGLNTTSASLTQTSGPSSRSPSSVESRSDAFTLFLVWGLIFEALYRHVASLHDHSILQHPARPEKSLTIQYRMLDTRHLASDNVIASIVECVDTEGREYAKQCLLSVVEIRNALSHGAILTYDDDVHFAYNNLLINAIQLLVDSGIHAMTKKRAYFEWQGTRNEQHGFHNDDYFTARAATFEMLENYGNLQEYAWIYKIEGSTRDRT